MNPLEIGFEEGKVTLLELPVETRFYNNCSDEGNFGKQKIKISQKNLGSWSDLNQGVSFQNKYIFSKNASEGRSFYVYSKPLELPFKVADLIYLIPKNKVYCFIKAPLNISTEIRDLRLENIVNVSQISKCPTGSENVCFKSGGNSVDCGLTDTIINTNAKMLRRGTKEVKFDGDTLMYAALFSERDVYECQIRRLMKRVATLASMYDEKATLIARNNCNSDLNLVGLENAAKSIQTLGQLPSVVGISNEIKIANDKAYCKLW